MTPTRIMVLGTVIFAAQIVRSGAADVFHMPAGQISLAIRHRGRSGQCSGHAGVEHFGRTTGRGRLRLSDRQI